MHYVVLVLSKLQVLNTTIIIIAGKQVCYDWSRGAENHNPANAKTSIYLHSPQVVSECRYHHPKKKLFYFRDHLRSIPVLFCYYVILWHSNLPHSEQEAEVKGKPRIATGRKWWHPACRKVDSCARDHVYSRALFLSGLALSCPLDVLTWFGHLLDEKSTPSNRW